MSIQICGEASRENPTLTSPGARVKARVGTAAILDGELQTAADVMTVVVGDKIPGMAKDRVRST